MKHPDAPASHLAPPLRAIPFLKTAADAEPIVHTARQREELARIGMRLRLPARMVIYREESAANGLGLSSVAFTVRQLQGMVSLQSEPGVGTRVTVQLPCLR